VLVRQRKDWFPIVATDLFCGILAAVIILDAVEPKEVGAFGKTILVEISYPNKGTRAAKDCADYGRIVFLFKDGAGWANTLTGGSTNGTQVGDECHLQSFFPDVHFEETLVEPSVFVTEFGGNVKDLKVTVQVSGQSEIQCAFGSQVCPVR
jgi:hypothetical protein